MTTSYLTRFFDRSFDWISTSGLRIVIIVIAIAIFLSIMKRVLTRFRHVYEGRLTAATQLKRADTLTYVIRDIARIVILVFGSMMILSEIGVDLKPLLAAAGIGGLAIGFGAQSLVKDVISGFFILLEDSVQVGDVVEIAGVGGLVEEVKLRTISLRDLSGNVHVVPNGVIDKVKNMTKLYAYYLFDVAIAYREDVDEVMALLMAIGEELRLDANFSNSLTQRSSSSAALRPSRFSNGE
jgi:small conductance mechanosensitive channel